MSARFRCLQPIFGRRTRRCLIVYDSRPSVMPTMEWFRISCESKLFGWVWIIILASPLSKWTDGSSFGWGALLESRRSRVQTLHVVELSQVFNVFQIGISLHYSKNNLFLNQNVLSNPTHFENSWRNKGSFFGEHSIIEWLYIGLIQWNK